MKNNELKKCFSWFIFIVIIIGLLFSGTASAASNNIVINEIMYNPMVEDSGKEWIEIYNAGTQTKNINGWTISNRTGAVAATLPNWDFPNGTYLVVHFGSGTNDNNFSDGDAHFFTNKSIDVFNNTEDEAALYTNAPGASSIIDFISWSSDGLYSGGMGHNYAVSAGIWDVVDYFDVIWTANGVLNGESIGRDKFSTDTNQPNDWDDHGGKDAYLPTPGTPNKGPLYKVEEGIMETQAEINLVLIHYGYNILYANHTIHDDLSNYA